MKISWSDAKTLFVFGGYIDLQTSECILSKWRYDELRNYRKIYPEIAIVPVKDYTDADYRYFACHPERYLRIPDLRMSGICYAVALDMGVSEIQLQEMGFNDEICSTTYPAIDEAIFNKDTLHGEKSYIQLDKINDYMRSIGKHCEFSSKCSREWTRHTKDLLCKKGIELDFQ